MARGAAHLSRNGIAYHLGFKGNGGTLLFSSIGFEVVEDCPCLRGSAHAFNGTMEQWNRLISIDWSLAKLNDLVKSRLLS